jgi:hypothetical protein
MVVASAPLLGAATDTGGTINFLTKVTASGIDVKVTEAPEKGGGVIINTSGWLAQLYAGPNEASLAPVGTAINFLSSGYLNGGKVVTPLPQGQPAVVQLRAWVAAYGGSWEQALSSGVPCVGATQSRSITITLGGENLSPPKVPANLVGLTSFGVGICPEPSPLALAALGGLILWALRLGQRDSRTRLGHRRRRNPMKTQLFTASCVAAWMVVASAPLLGAATDTGGTINFITKVPSSGIDVRVNEENGWTIINSSGWRAQLYAGPTEPSLAPVGTAINFLASGYLNGGKVVTPLPQGQPAVVQLRVWAVSYGATWEQVMSAVGCARATQSRSITITLGGDNLSPPKVPANLVGLTSFGVGMCPEPSPLALAALGGLVLWACAHGRATLGSHCPAADHGQTLSLLYPLH